MKKLFQMKVKLQRLLDPGLLLLVAIMIVGFVLTLGHADRLVMHNATAALTLPEMIYRAMILNDSVFDGQLWRLATYAFLHKSFGFLATGLWALVFCYLKARQYSTPKQLVAVFMLTAIFGGAMQIYSNWMCPVVGSSGGIFGLWGFWVGIAIMHGGKPEFNKRTLKLLGVSVVAVYALAILLSDSATVAHNTGFMFGGFLGIVLPLCTRVPKHFSKQGRHAALERAS